MSCAVAPGPIIIEIGSPGTTRIRTKTTRATPNSVGTTSSRRRSRTREPIVAAPGRVSVGRDVARRTKPDWRSVARRPQSRLGALFVGHALGVADQLDLHPPGREHVGDRLARGRTFLDRERTHEGLQAVGLGFRDRGLDVLDVEGDVMAAVVAVLRLLGPLPGRAVLEQLDVRALAAAHHHDLLDDRARIDVDE